MHPLLAAAAALLLLTAAPRPPRLVLFVTVDSMGTDVLLRNRPHLHAGLANLVNQGAFFPNAFYEQAETVTAAGHATLATGAYPWRHGVVGNSIFNRATGRLEPIFADFNHPVLEAPMRVQDVSPDRLMSETLADRLRLASQGRSHVIAVAAKARAAIALAGHLGTAWWFDDQVGKFVTGTYYAKEFPQWVKDFNAAAPADALFGASWGLSLAKDQYLGQDDRPFEESWLGLGRTFPHLVNGGLSAPGPKARQALEGTPFMDELLVQFARAALQSEQLGHHATPDALFVSFSAIDRIYHLFGPYSWETQDALVRLDRGLGELINACAKAAGGRSNLLVVLTADHGGAAIPEAWSEAGMPAGRVNPAPLKDALNRELKARFGVEPALAFEDTDLYLNDRLLAEHGLDAAAVRRAAATWLSGQPEIAYAVAKDDLDSAAPLAGYARALRRSYYPGRSGDVVLILRPFQVMTGAPAGTAHGMPYAYDSQVPIALLGRGFRAGLYRELVHPVDVAPTVASLLQIGFPAQAEGSLLPLVYRHTD